MKNTTKHALAKSAWCTRSTHSTVLTDLTNIKAPQVTHARKSPELFLIRKLSQQTSPCTHSPKSLLHMLNTSAKSGIRWSHVGVLNHCRTCSAHLQNSGIRSLRFEIAANERTAHPLGNDKPLYYDTLLSKPATHQSSSTNLPEPAQHVAYQHKQLSIHACASHNMRNVHAPTHLTVLTNRA